MAASILNGGDKAIVTTKFSTTANGCLSRLYLIFRKLGDLVTKFN